MSNLFFRLPPTIWDRRRPIGTAGVADTKEQSQQRFNPNQRFAR